jgi:hypothetical protein
LQPFYIHCNTNEKFYDIIIDSGTYTNVVSINMVTKL